ncbi:dnaj subfamily c member 24 [Holotrichia oblita]|uniref:Dnaj subfamily c member 24 n=3 Tax=Holotrichia oblita TaxID=644536 RepID=A0ACB9T9N3_HOLOL|nr:dnaj subfamily c member 24 [Holotrichia oblita]KAI4463476.1 dnaj subfamily c member 24 [Holotrichia oblita]KAI4463484.1 dnaj subfamily c member 24 [Holotrichia oblita]
MCVETYYTILGCHETAKFEEIKRNYQRLIKYNHPDKGEQQSPDKFIQINEAWQILKDDKLRREYDASLLHDNINNRPLVYAEINVKDLSFTQSLAYYLCRCGQNIEIDKSELVEEETLFECTECSNCIAVFSNK